MAANSEKTAKKPRGKGKPFPKGVSGNPAGRPKDGESWSAILKDLTNKNPEEIAEMFGNNELGNTYRKFPKGVQMKYQVGARVIASLMFEPSASMLKELIDRIDGKVPETINHTGTLKVPGLQEALKTIYGSRSTTD